MSCNNVFFSSRRRHTSSLRDWSSDVCSSDLVSSERRVLETSAEEHLRLLRAFVDASGSGDMDGLLSLLAEDATRSEEHTSELQSRRDLVCRLLLEKKKKKKEARHRQ